MRAPGRRAGADIDALRADDAVDAALFETMCEPAGNSADGKGWGEEGRGKTKPVQQQRCVELDICLEIAAGFVLFKQAKRDRFDATGEVV